MTTTAGFDWLAFAEEINEASEGHWPICEDLDRRDELRNVIAAFTDADTDAIRLKKVIAVLVNLDAISYEIATKYSPQTWESIAARVVRKEDDEYHSEED